MSAPSLGLLLVSLLWGTTFVAVKAGLEDSSPLMFVGIRFALATLTSLPLLRRRDLPGAFRAGLPLGIVLAAGYAAQTIGLSSTTPSRSAFVTGMNVAIVPLWAALLLRRRPGVLSIGGLAATVPGLWLLTSPGSEPWNPGDAWTAACAAFFALHVVLVNRWGPRHDATSLLVSQLAVTAVVCLVAAPALEEVHLQPTRRLAGTLLLTAVLATTGTTWLQLRFQPRVDPTRAALIYVTEPVFASFFSWIVFAERMSGAAWAGGGLILVGMVLSGAGPGSELPTPALGPARPRGSEGPSRSPRG